MSETALRYIIRTALHDAWWRAIRDKTEDSPDGHVERLTDEIMRALGPDAIVLPLDDARHLFDLAIDTPLLCSGSFETDDVALLRKLATLIKVDPATATPDEFVYDFPHAFKPFTTYVWDATAPGGRRPETDAEVYARLGENPDRCNAGSYNRLCRRPASDPIHQAAEMGA